MHDANTQIASFDFLGSQRIRSETILAFRTILKPSKGMRITPPAHAEQILQQAYGQIFFCNKQAWALRPEGIEEYADAASIKRAHLEQFISFAAKGRTSRQLLALYKNLTRKSEGQTEK